MNLGRVYSEEERAAQREYYRKWRADNRDKVRAINKRYWAKKAAQAVEVDGDESKERD